MPQFNGCSNWYPSGGTWWYYCSTSFFFGDEYEQQDWAYYYYVGDPRYGKYWKTYRCNRDNVCAFIN